MIFIIHVFTERALIELLDRRYIDHQSFLIFFGIIQRNWLKFKFFKAKNFWSSFIGEVKLPVYKSSVTRLNDVRSCVAPIWGALSSGLLVCKYMCYRYMTVLHTGEVADQYYFKVCMTSWPRGIGRGGQTSQIFARARQGPRGGCAVGTEGGGATLRIVYRATLILRRPSSSSIRWHLARFITRCLCCTRGQGEDVWTIILLIW